MSSGVRSRATVAKADIDEVRKIGEGEEVLSAARSWGTPASGWRAASAATVSGAPSRRDGRATSALGRPAMNLAYAVGSPAAVGSPGAMVVSVTKHSLTDSLRWPAAPGFGGS